MTAVGLQNITDILANELTHPAHVGNQRLYEEIQRLFEENPCGTLEFFTSTLNSTVEKEKIVVASKILEKYFLFSPDDLGNVFRKLILQRIEEEEDGSFLQKTLINLIEVYLIKNGNPCKWTDLTEFILGKLNFQLTCPTVLIRFVEIALLLPLPCQITEPEMPFDIELIDSSLIIPFISLYALYTSRTHKETNIIPLFNRVIDSKDDKTAVEALKWLWTGIKCKTPSMNEQQLVGKLVDKAVNPDISIEVRICYLLYIQKFIKRLDRDVSDVFFKDNSERLYKLISCLFIPQDEVDYDDIYSEVMNVCFELGKVLPKEVSTQISINLYGQQQLHLKVASLAFDLDNHNLNLLRFFLLSESRLIRSIACNSLRLFLRSKWGTLDIDCMVLLDLLLTCFETDFDEDAVDIIYILLKYTSDNCVREAFPHLLQALISSPSQKLLLCVKKVGLTLGNDLGFYYEDIVTSIKVCLREMDDRIFVLTEYLDLIFSSNAQRFDRIHTSLITQLSKEKIEMFTPDTFKVILKVTDFDTINVVFNEIIEQAAKPIEGILSFDTGEVAFFFERCRLPPLGCTNESIKQTIKWIKLLKWMTPRLKDDEKIQVYQIAVKRVRFIGSMKVRLAAAKLLEKLDESGFVINQKALFNWIIVEDTLQVICELVSLLDFSIITSKVICVFVTHLLNVLNDVEDSDEDAYFLAYSVCHNFMEHDNAFLFENLDSIIRSLDDKANTIISFSFIQGIKSAAIYQLCLVDSVNEFVTYLLDFASNQSVELVRLFVSFASPLIRKFSLVVSPCPLFSLLQELLNYAYYNDVVDCLCSVIFSSIGTSFISDNNHIINEIIDKLPQLDLDEISPKINVCIEKCISFEDEQTYDVLRKLYIRIK